MTDYKHAHVSAQIAITQTEVVGTINYLAQSLALFFEAVEADIDDLRSRIDMLSFDAGEAIRLRDTTISE